MDPGTVIGGRFKLEREAGVGGMGTVFRATDQGDGVRVAVKILHGRDAIEVERFAREAAILAELRHPGVVRYVAHGTTPSGERYLAMEWLEGVDLGQRLERRGLSMTDSFAIARRAAEALAAAHARGVIHRDIKPSNLFLVGDDVERVKVVDFGIARVARDGHRLTRTGVLLGTPGYIAPEQVQGPPAHDPSVDVFSLGCVLFECLTGHPAFEGTNPMAVLAKLLLQAAPRLRTSRPDIPDEIDLLVARMMAKDPGERPRDAAALIEELDAVRDLAVSSDAPTTLSFGAVPAPRAPSPRAAALTLSEQRLVTVVLAGDPESDEPERSIRPLVAELQAAIDVYRGHVTALSGGSLLVTLWGSGSAVDRAESAAQCALAIRAKLPRLPVAVVTGRGLASSRVVDGDVIDGGVRMLRFTIPGTIRVDEVTAGMTGARFHIEREGRIYTLRGESVAATTAKLLLGKPTSCVGRSRELSILEGVLAGAIGEPAASAVLVTGPAGAGKSRLASEFLDKVRRRGERVEILTGRPDALASSSPFGVIADAIRRSAAIRDGEPLALRREKLAARLSRRLAGHELARATAFLGELISAPSSDTRDVALRAARENAMLMGDAMRGAWEEWLVAECGAGPVLLVLEDLHWGDAATVRLIDSSLRNLRDLPLMVLVLARPEIHEHFPGLWAERDVQVVKLSPLSRKASEKLVREALGDEVGADRIARVVDRGGGNPFYLEELVRAVAAGRGDALPDSIAGIVEARLDAEGAEAKRILRAASVFGDRFSKNGVVTLLGGDLREAEVVEWLSLLTARELVAHVRAPGAESGEYVFCHAFVREAAYATLTDTDRALGHRLAGDWLEEHGQGESLALAEHWNRGGEPARAVRWFRRAAEQALEANDLGAALSRAQRGVQSGASGEELAALNLVEAEASAWLGSFAVAEQSGREAMAHFAVGSTGWFRAITQVVIASGKLGGFDRVQECVEPACAATPAKGARGAQMSCLSWCATYLALGGLHAEADALIAKIDRAIGDTASHDVQIVALLQQTRAIRASSVGDSGTCLDGFGAALDAFELAGDQRNACAMRSNLGFIFAELGDFEGAEDALRSALSGATRMGIQNAEMGVLQNLGLVVAQRGRIDEGRLLEQRAVDAFQRQGDPRMEGVSRTYLAKIALLSGDFEVAEREACSAAEAVQVAPPLYAAAVAVLSRALLGLGHAEEALAAARTAFRTLEELGALEEGESLVRLVYAEALAATGHEEEFARAIADAKDHLLARADKIRDSSWRDRFLAGVPDNAKTLTLAGVEPPVLDT